ncbi:putative endonuclease [Desulfohalotomaculum tongense]|uniref:YraN family protein n=1 Tax=Desulforadius tongensis TaxID=1216062 RepID=UPI00195ECE7D|nr:YraN family protein [Desulforadius tongensis]MBM7854353.1 putative endonuclease [Desulforadius tongensis]
MTFFRRDTGKMGEDKAVAAVRRRGMRVRCRNYRCRLGEIDIIAEDGGTLVFVEVRSRRTGGYGLPQESIGPQKAAKVRRAAQYYMAVNELSDADCRFDVVAVKMDLKGKVENIEYIKNAF